MTNMILGGWYHFSSMDAHNEFSKICDGYTTIANKVGSKQFKVTSVDDEGNVYVIAFENKHTGELEASKAIIYNCHSHFFTPVYEKFWGLNYGYQLDDLLGFKDFSVINKRFIDLVGYNPFKITKTDNAGGFIRGIEIEIMGADNGKLERIQFALTDKELKFFKEWNRPIIRGFSRGISAEIAARNGSYIAQRDVLTAAIEAEKAKQPVDNESKEFKATISGSMTFVVDDEYTRLETIKILEKMVFKNESK